MVKNPIRVNNFEVNPQDLRLHYDLVLLYLVVLLVLTKELRGLSLIILSIV